LNFVDVASSASLTERAKGVSVPGCFRGAADFRAETQARITLTVDHDNAARNREYTEAQWLVISGQRRCGYFERNRAGLTPEGHLELQHRREEWRRTALVAIVSAIIGGLIATLPTILFGHDVTVIIGR
jgi:hypothetical protein